MSFKTTSERYPDLEAHLIAHHEWTNPEVTAVPLARASAAYTEGMLALQRMRQGGSQGRSARSSNLVPAAQESVGLDVVLVENACASVRWSAKFARVTKGQYVYA